MFPSYADLCIHLNLTHAVWPLKHSKKVPHLTTARLQEKRGLFSASCHLLQMFPSNQSVSLSPPQHTLDISPTISAPACVLGEQNPCSVRVIGKMMQSCSLLHPNVCVDFHANHMPSEAPPAITRDRRYKSAI